MALRLTQLDHTNRSAFEALLADAWQQNWGADLARALIRWRYYDRPPGGNVWLAFDGAQCVAMLDSFVRPYLLDGERTIVREPCDWYCLPKYRPFGIGIRLMREMMACPEPAISIGGSEATRAILPRLGWTRLPDVQNYVLPIKARGLASAVLRNRWPATEAYAKAIPGFIPLRPPRRGRAPRWAVGRVAEWRQGMPTVLPAPLEEGLVQVLEPVDQAWIARMPRDFAQPLGLVFYLDEAPIGLSLSQTEPTAAGTDGCIVHLQIARSDQDVVDWVIAETASQLAQRGVGLVRCSASTPGKVSALRRAGFVGRRPLPSHWWSKGGGVPAPAKIDAGFLRGDDALPLAALHGRHLTPSWRVSHGALSGTGGIVALSEMVSRLV